MINLTQIELQNLKKLINNQDISYSKMTSYANDAVDPQIKQIFNQAAKDALITKQKLIQFLNND